MKTYSVIRHELENGVISLSGDSVTVTDSKSQDSVTLSGLNRKQIARGLRFWVNACEWSHYESTNHKDDVVFQLLKLQESLTATLEKMAPKAEEPSATGCES